jgi:hypothetical protein
LRAPASISKNMRHFFILIACLVTSPAQTDTSQMFIACAGQWAKPGSHATGSGAAQHTPKRSQSEQWTVLPLTTRPRPACCSLRCQCRPSASRESKSRPLCPARLSAVACTCNWSGPQRYQGLLFDQAPQCEDRCARYIEYILLLLLLFKVVVAGGLWDGVREEQKGAWGHCDVCINIRLSIVEHDQHIQCTTLSCSCRATNASRCIQHSHGTLPAVTPSCLIYYMGRCRS